MSMSWGNFGREIQEDKRVEELRLEKAYLRAKSIRNDWEEIWVATIVSLETNAKQLDGELHDYRVLEFGNSLCVVRLYENCYLLQNTAFPRVEIEIKCVPETRILVAGKEWFSALRCEAIPLRQFNFAVDKNNCVCVRESAKAYAPSDVADKIVPARTSRCKRCDTRFCDVP